MRLLFFFLFSIIGIVRAETLQNLSQNNASPDEIIRQLNTVSASSPNADIPTSESIQVGTLVSLIHKGDDTPFYDFTIALTDGRVITVSDTNHIPLKPGDTVILTGDDRFWRIKDKISK